MTSRDKVTARESRLLEAATQFADNLTHRVSAIVPMSASFSALAHSTGGSDRVVVAVLADDFTAQHIPLTIGGKPMLQLFVKMNCALDSTGEYLAVDKSWIHVRLGEREKDEPLFRYEFVRKDIGTPIPSAHMQIHAHRDEFLYLLTAAEQGRPAERRRKGNVPRLAKFHFPVGGHRYRPCLEDVLQALILEFGVDCRPNWQDMVEEGRAQWRRRQLRTVVRDAPEEAADELRRLGWDVKPPAQPAHENTSALRAF